MDSRTLLVEGAFDDPPSLHIGEDKSVERILIACILEVDLYVKILSFALHSISKPAGFTNTLKPPTVKSSDVRVVFQHFSVQQSNAYR